MGDGPLEVFHAGDITCDIPATTSTTRAAAPGKYRLPEKEVEENDSGERKRDDGVWKSDQCVVHRQFFTEGTISATTPADAPVGGLRNRHRRVDRVNVP